MDSQAGTARERDEHSEVERRDVVHADHHLSFAVIGAQKCATSWLYYCLRDHPEICVPAKKQEAGYIGGAHYRAQGGESWFFKRFSPMAGQIRGDVSVEYLFDPAAPASLAPYLKRPKLVVSLRQPVDRLVSGYFWLVRRGRLANFPLERGIAPVLDQAPGFPSTIDGPLEEVVRRGCYGPQLDRFSDQFDPAALNVLLYEDIEADALSAIGRVYRFIGVDPSFVPDSLDTRPKRNSYNPWLLRLENATNSRLVAGFSNVASQAIAAVAPRKDVLPRAIREKLAMLYAPTIVETQDALARVPAAQRPAHDHLTRRWQQR